MKKLLLFIAAGSFSVGAMAQLQVSTTPENRNVLLEDLTGVFCGFCPDGAKRADQFKAANPGRVVIIGNHAGYYAQPGANPGYVDFRTNEGIFVDEPALKNGCSNCGYPAGLLNRSLHDYTYDPGYAGTSRSYWSSVGTLIMDEPSVVNLAADAYYRPGSDEIIIHVAGYYTANGDGSDFLTVAILQDSLQSYQSGAAGYKERIDTNTNLYIQMDVLRAYVTSDNENKEYFGEEITTTTQGTRFDRTYVYKVELEYIDTDTTAALRANNPEPVIEHMKVAVFMAESGTHSEVITAIEVEVEERTVGVDELTNLKNVEIYPNPFQTNATLTFNLASSDQLAVNVYDVTGKMVYSLPGESYRAGQHRINLDGSSLKSGVYYVNVVSSNSTMTKKLILNK